MCLARAEPRPWPWDAPPSQGCCELRAAALALLYQNSSLRAELGGDEPLGAESRAESSCGTGQICPCTSVSVSSSARFGSCTTLSISCCAGCLHPLGWRKQIPLAISFPAPSRAGCGDNARITLQSVGAGLMAGPHGTVGLHFDSLGMAFADPRAAGSSQLSAHHGKAPVLENWRHLSSGRQQCQIPRELETKQIQSKTRISQLCSWRAPGGAQGGTG